jgi:hypothetical protein
MKIALAFVAILALAIAVWIYFHLHRFLSKIGPKSRFFICVRFAVTFTSDNARFLALNQYVIIQWHRK